MINAIIGIAVVLAFAYAIYLSVTKKSTPPVDKEKIKAEVDAITDIDEMRRFAQVHGVDSFLIDRFGFSELKAEIYRMYNL